MTRGYIERRDGHRIPNMPERRYDSFRFLANRRNASMIGELQTIGRTNSGERQEIADKLAAITETAKLVRVAPNLWRIEFTTTHKIVPIEKEED